MQLNGEKLQDGGGNQRIVRFVTPRYWEMVEMNEQRTKDAIKGEAVRAAAMIRGWPREMGIGRPGNPMR